MNVQHRILGGLTLLVGLTLGAFLPKDAVFADEPGSLSAVNPVRSSGPFLGNGIKNGWADQTSIQIWTRTTRSPEMLVEGAKFLSLSAGEANRLAKRTDVAEIHSAQIPAGSTLDEMFGACPAAAGEVRLTYFPIESPSDVQTTAWKQTSIDSDGTEQWRLSGLKPGTAYTLIAEAKPIGESKVTAVVRGGFETAPAASSDRQIEFCFTTCHDFIRRDDGMRGHKIYPAMRSMHPDFIIHAGDIEYYDKPDPWAMTLPLMRFKWGRIFALPSNRDFYSTTTSYFLKDDHDTLKNDCWSGQRYGSVTFDQGVRLFNEEQFPSNPSRYKSIRWGKHLEIWLLEGRDFRSGNNQPDGPGKSILGTAQKQWLLEGLGKSDATFKLVCSPTPIVGPDRNNKHDNHSNQVFEFEGEQLRDAFARIENVIVLCGDRHWQYASTDSETGLWEFGCGPGSEKHQLGWKEGDVRPTHQFLRVAGGFLSGQVSVAADGPKLVLRHHAVDGTEVSAFRFPTNTESNAVSQPNQ